MSACLACLNPAACDGDGPPGCWHREGLTDEQAFDIFMAAGPLDRLVMMGACTRTGPAELRGDAPEGAGGNPPSYPPRQSTLAGASAPAIFPQVNEMANPAQVKQLCDQAVATLEAAVDKAMGIRAGLAGGVADPVTISMANAQAAEIANDGANAKALLLQAVTAL